LLGGSGFGFETPEIASTGYVLGRDAWGQGYATQALTAIIEVAPNIALRHLYATVHADHTPSIHVLEKCGFQLVEKVPVHFPNLDGGCQASGLRYVRRWNN
jgi:8-oxo-dGTP diphosphatase